MELTINEIAVIINSLEARKEWAEDEGEIADEQTYLDSALKKLKSLKFDLQKNDILSHPKGQSI
jgi:hypothetical protein